MNYQVEPNVVTRVFKEGGRKVRVRKGTVLTEAEVRVMCYEDGGRGHELNNVNSL